MPINKQLVKQVFERDGYKCVYCGCRQMLTPHHLIYQSHGGIDDLSNLITLCIICHNAIHSGFLKIWQKVLTIDLQYGNILFVRQRGWKPGRDHV